MPEACSWKAAHFWVHNTREHFEYTLKVPADCSCAFSAGENFYRKTYKSQDSAFIYIDDYVIPFTFPRQIAEKYGPNANVKIIGTDTLVVSGQDSTGRCWKIIRNKYVVYGYWNVQPKDKAKFETALSSVQFRVDSKYSEKKNELAKNKKGFDYIEFKCRRF